MMKLVEPLVGSLNGLCHCLSKVFVSTGRFMMQANQRIAVVGIPYGRRPRFSRRLVENLD